MLKQMGLMSHALVKLRRVFCAYSSFSKTPVIMILICSCLQSQLVFRKKLLLKICFSKVSLHRILEQAQATQSSKDRDPARVSDLPGRQLPTPGMKENPAGSMQILELQ